MRDVIGTPYLGRMTQQVHGVIPEFTIGDRLRKARELTGLDQVQFATEIDISRNTVGNYENGNVKPRRLALKAWAMRTGVPLEWLETGVASSSPDGGGSVTSDTQPTVQYDDRPGQGAELLRLVA